MKLFKIKKPPPARVFHIHGFEAHDRILKMSSKLRPVSVLEHQKRRFGCHGDGGYVMLDDFYGIKTALSFGIDNNASWDVDVAARSVTVHQYDHTIEHWIQRDLAEMVKPDALPSDSFAPVEREWHFWKREAPPTERKGRRSKVHVR